MRRLFDFNFHTINSQMDEEIDFIHFLNSIQSDNGDMKRLYESKSRILCK